MSESNYNTDSAAYNITPQKKNTRSIKKIATSRTRVLARTDVHYNRSCHAYAAGSPPSPANVVNMSQVAEYHQDTD